MKRVYHPIRRWPRLKPQPQAARSPFPVGRCRRGSRGSEACGRGDRFRYPVAHGRTGREPPLDGAQDALIDAVAAVQPAHDRCLETGGAVLALGVSCRCDRGGLVSGRRGRSLDRTGAVRQVKPFRAGCRSLPPAWTSCQTPSSRARSHPHFDGPQRSALRRDLSRKEPPRGYRWYRNAG